MGIHLTTAKVTFKSIVQNNQKLLQSEYIKSLSNEGEHFCFKVSKHKIYSEKEVLFPERDYNKIFFITSGKIYMLYKRESDGFQKLIKVLEPGDFFAMRKDFKNIFFYVKEPTITFVLSEADLGETFKLAPKIKDLLFSFFRKVAQELESLNNSITKY